MPSYMMQTPKLQQMQRSIFSDVSGKNIIEKVEFEP